MNLKKLLGRKDLYLITAMIQDLDPMLVVRALDGSILLGALQLHRQDSFKVHLDSDASPPWEGHGVIQVEGEVIGWVESEHYAAPIAAFFTYLASREAEKRSLAKELLGKYKEISLLFTLSEKVMDSFSIEDVALLTLDESCNLLDSEQGVVLLDREDGQDWTIAATYGKDLAADTWVQLGKVILERLEITGRGELMNDLPPESPCSLAAQGMSGLLYVPLKSKERLLGAVILARRHDKPYTAEDAKILTTLATQASGFIGALLHEHKLKESRQNALIFRLSSQIRDSLELNAILTTAVKEIQSVLQLDRCLFLWCEWMGDALVPTFPTASCTINTLELDALNIVTEARVGSLPSLIGRYRSAQVGTLGQRLAQRERVQLANVRQASELTASELEGDGFLLTHNLGAFLAMPLLTRSHRIGVLCCAMDGRARAWKSDEVALLEVVTTQLAIALDQAELYEQSQLAAVVAEEKARQLETALEQLKSTQAQLVQSEKMSSLGQMVAGVAHEINNPINFIHGNLTHIDHYIRDLLVMIETYEQEYSQPNQRIQAKRDEIDLAFLRGDLPKLRESMQMGTNRIQAIVNSLRNFSRLDETGYKFADIHEGLESTLSILEHRLQTAGHQNPIQLKKRYSQLPLVPCYPGDLNQVFLNIISNAIDALEDAIVNQMLPDTPLLSIHTECLDNNTVLICIMDNAWGIDEAIQSKIFDPFFTTKPIGQGSGLGLSVSYQIITEQHQGTLTCHSRLGEGSLFAITLPLQAVTSVESADLGAYSL